MTEQIVCPNCATIRARGIAHRCPAPGLFVLTDASQKVLDACRAVGGRPVIVGGSVRDALISNRNDESPTDVDIEVSDAPSYESLSAHLGKLGRVDLTGVSFGVLKISLGREDFDVSLRPAEPIIRGADFDHDLREVDAFGRRDFTLNAMGWDPETEELIDPWGGAADLRAGVLRHTTAVFGDDPLRVLRAMQLTARFGFDLAKETVELSRTLSDRFGDLATERVWQEWRKVATQGTHISKALQVLEDTGWLAHFPALSDLRGTPQDAIWHPEGDVFVHSGLAADVAAANAVVDDLPAADREIAVFGALLHDVGKPATTVIGDRITSAGHAEVGAKIACEFLSSIGAPNSVVNRVAPLVREHMSHVSTAGMPSTSAVRRLMRRLAQSSSGATIFDWARVVDADCAGRGAGAKQSPAGLWLKIATRIGPTPQTALLRGEHLIAEGWVPEVDGRTMGAVIKASLSAQDEGEFDDEEGAVAWFRANGEGIRVSLRPRAAYSTSGDEDDSTSGESGQRGRDR